MATFGRGNIMMLAQVVYQRLVIEPKEYPIVWFDSLIEEFKMTKVCKSFWATFEQNCSDVFRIRVVRIPKRTADLLDIELNMTKLGDDSKLVILGGNQERVAFCNLLHFNKETLLHYINSANNMDKLDAKLFKERIKYANSLGILDNPIDPNFHINAKLSKLEEIKKVG